MENFPKILIFLMASLCLVSSDFPPACMKMLDKNLFLFECCEYPVIPYISTVYNKCLGECSAFDYCCFQECSAKESGIYVDGKIDTGKARKIFAMQKGFAKFENLTEGWRKVVDESVDKCSSISSSLDEKACEYIYESMACIFKENFLNCPSMKDKTECKEVKNEMEECSKSDGAWRFLTDAFNTVKPRTYARRYAETSS